MTAELQVQTLGPPICIKPSATSSGDSNNKQRRQEFSSDDACVLLEPRADRLN